MSSILDLLQEHEIQLTDLNYNTLVKLRKRYETQNAELTGERDKAETSDSELKKYLLALMEGDKDVTEVVKSFVTEVRTMLYSLVDQNPNTIMPLVEAMSELKTDTLNERDYWLNKVKQDAAPKEIPKDEEYEAKRAEAKNLSDLIRQLYEWIAQQNPDAVPHDKRGDEFGTTEFPLNAQKAGGEIVKGKFLPKLSNLARESGSEGVTGRAASNSNLKFAWNGNAINSMPSEIAHDVVSDFKAGFVIDWTGIRKAFKDAGHEITATMKSYTHEFPTGKLTVSGTAEDKPDRSKQNK